MSRAQRAANLVGLFLSQRQTWRTPTALFEALNAEFGFTLDPCTVEQTDYDGLLASWEGERVFVNPPYSQCKGWVAKCWTEAVLAEVVVALLPARTDAHWFHTYVLPYAEIRFLEGRLRYDDAPQRAPFASLIAVWR